MQTLQSRTGSCLTKLPAPVEMLPELFLLDEGYAQTQPLHICLQLRSPALKQSLPKSPLCHSPQTPHPSLQNAPNVHAFLPCHLLSLVNSNFKCYLPSSPLVLLPAEIAHLTHLSTMMGHLHTLYCILTTWLLSVAVVCVCPPHCV